MRNFLFLFTFLFVQFSVQAQSKVPFEQTASDYGFKGKVKTVIEEELWSDGSQLSRMEYEFDSLQRLTKRRDYGSKNKLKRIITNTYGSNGRLVLSIDEDPTGRWPYRKDSMIYDKAGNNTERWTLDNSGKATYILIFTYNASGKVLSCNAYGAGKVPASSYENLYDKSGNHIKVIYKDKDGKLSYWDDMTYDKSGSMITWTEYKIDSSVFYTSNYKYNEKNQLVEERKAYSDPGKNYRRTYAYDAMGRKTESVEYNSNEEIYSKYTWQFDQNGNILEQSNQTYQGVRNFSYLFIYDKELNWISRKTMLAREDKYQSLFQTEKRVIEYY